MDLEAHLSALARMLDARVFGERRLIRALDRRLGECVVPTDRDRNTGRAERALSGLSAHGRVEEPDSRALSPPAWAAAGAREGRGEGLALREGVSRTVAAEKVGSFPCVAGLIRCNVLLFSAT